MDRVGSAAQVVQDCAGVFDDCARRLQGAALADLGATRARRVLAMLEIVMATAERHAPGHGMFATPAASELLSGLAALACHPPRGSHVSQWLDSWAPDLIVYTPMPAERVFCELVRRCSETLTGMCDFGFDLASGAADPADPDLCRHLDAISHEVHDLRRDFARFRSPDATGADSAHLWFLHFRQYLAPLDLCGTRVLGPNPAFVASWPAADILFGLADETYLADTRERFTGYLPEDIALIERAMASPTVPDALRAGQAPETLLDAYRRAVRALQSLSGRHWAAIEEHLVDASARLADDSRLGKALSSEAGVSGRALEKTWARLASRRGDNPARRATLEWGRSSHRSQK